MRANSTVRGPGGVNASTRLLGGSFPLVVWLERWVALAWIGEFALFALIFGMTARSAAGAHGGASTFEQQIARMGGHQGGATGAWIGYEFVYLAALIAFAAAAQISAMRGEEADGRLDNLLARHLNRGTWLAGRLGFRAALVLVAGLAAGLAGWIGVVGWHSGIGFGVMDAGRPQYHRASPVHPRPRHTAVRARTAARGTNPSIR